MKRPIALLALFLAGSVMAGPSIEEARGIVKTYSNDQLCVSLFSAQSMYVDTIASELATRNVNCSRYADELERREQSRRANQQQMDLANTIQLMQMFQPQPMPNLIQPQTHCVTRYAGGQWYTDCR